MAEKQVANKIRKKLQGVVVSINGSTIKVRVESKYPHPIYKKIVATHKTYLVHSEDDKVEVGDKVTIEEGRPVSKSKKFYLINKEK